MSRCFSPSRSRSPATAPFLPYAFAILVTSLLASGYSHAAGTIYVDNTKACPGGPGTSPANAFCSIANALNSFAGGTNTVVEVKGTGTPYREQVKVVPSDSGSAAQPLVLFARGAVTLEGADTASLWVPQYANGVKLWAAKVNATTSCRQVIMNDIRYPEFGADSSIFNLPPGKSHFDDVADTVYAYFPDSAHNYLGDLGYLCVRSPVIIAASNVVLDGFTIRRGKFDGVLVDSTAAGDPNMVRGVTIQNCTVQECGENGIDLTRAILSSVIANICANNTSHGISLKSRPDTVSPAVANCNVLRNVCYGNNNPSVDRGGANGIRIGNFRGPTTGHHVVEGNRTYLNEDSGIEVNSSDANVLRFNQSWQNLDHGFDHVAACSTRHVGDLAYGNDRDGFSVERNSLYTSLRNCVMADNGRAANRQDYELEVIGAARDSFRSDYNAVYRPTRSQTGCGAQWSEVADSVAISWRSKDTQNDSCAVRCPYADSCFATAARFSSATVNPLHNEGHSKDGRTTFVDAVAGSLRPRWGSSVVDRADTTVAGWSTTDPTGVARHDCSGVGNTGNPWGAYGDVGPLEYDDGMSPISVLFGVNFVRVTLTGKGRYGNASWKPSWFEILLDGAVKVHTDNPSAWPGSIDEFVAADSCAEISVQVRTQDEYADTAYSNIVTHWTSCGEGGGCNPAPCEIERPGGARAIAAGEEHVDFPLALGWAGANPSPGIGGVSWSIPRAQAGTPYELAIFDVAGRRIATIAKGTASPGRFVEEVSFRGRGGQTPSGMVFVRLRVGREIISRTVVVVH